VAVLGQIASMLRDRLPDGELAMLRQMLDAPDVGEAGRSALHFGLAHVLDTGGHFAEAARHLERANALQTAALQKRGRSYDPAKYALHVEALCAAFTADYFRRVQGFGLDTETPMFVVGMPRSGTTLVEQILASHSRVFGAGEIKLTQRSFHLLPSVL